MHFRLQFFAVQFKILDAAIYLPLLCFQLLYFFEQDFGVGILFDDQKVLLIVFAYGSLKLLLVDKLFL